MLQAADADQESTVTKEWDVMHWFVQLPAVSVSTLASNSGG